MQSAGIVLCGGESRRMGTPKAGLPCGPEMLLQRVVRLLAEAADPIVVVAAAGQTLPALPASVRLARDVRPQRGPLEGLRAGLGELSADCPAVLVTTCDAPLLVPALLRRLVELLREHDDAAVPIIGGREQPLTAVYRPARVLPAVERLLAVDRLRVRDLLEEIATRRIAAADLLAADPDLASFENANEPAHYRELLRRAGIHE